MNHRNWPIELTALSLVSCTLLGGCILPVPHYTANTVQATGRVIDKKTKRPIAKASVVIEGYHKTQVATDREGSFTSARDTSFRPVLFILPFPRDKFYTDTLLVGAPGYLNARVKLFESPGGDPINHVPIITLKEPIELHPKQ